MTNLSPQARMFARLLRRSPLSEADRAAVLDLSCTVRSIPAQNYFVREGEQSDRCIFLLSGFAFRHKLTADGARQIVGLLLPGDFIDLQQLFLNEADHNIQALTRVEIAEAPVAELQKLAATCPNVARAMWIDVLIEGSILRETLLSVGRRDGPARLAHLLCEFEMRLRVSGLADLGYEFPMTQEQFGDATGLTSVHVNRTLKLLEREGLIDRTRKTLRITDWLGLQARADFNPHYLHLDQARVWHS